MQKNIEFYAITMLIFSLFSCATMGGISPKAKNLVDNGNEYLDKGEYDQAIELYYQALEIEPNYTRAYFNLAIAYGEKKEYDKTIDFYSTVIKNEPNNEDAYYWRGRAYYNIGKIDNCMNDMMKVIFLNKGNEGQLTDASTLIGMIYFQDDNYHKAIEYLTISINRGTKKDVIYSYRAMAYYNTKNYKLAFQDANEALRLNPDNGSAKDLLAFAETNGITLGESGRTNISVTVEIGKTINEYVQDFPYLTAVSAYLLIDNRNDDTGNIFLYLFDENTKKLKSAIWKKYSSDRRNWFNNVLTQWISEGHNVEQLDEYNRRTIIDNTPVTVNDEYAVTQYLEMDENSSSLYYVIKYKE